MLKRIHIENFQSHKDTIIDFTNGLNVVIGESDGGKSSIIRAISAVCFNMWDNDSIRVGQLQTKITLETEKGVVTLVKNNKQKINTYFGKKFQGNIQFKFDSVGTTVPDIVYQITGMKPLKIGDSSVDIPNVMFQLEKHYMLAEVSGKACTSNLIARIFDKVIGLGGMQQLITQISSSMIVDKKQITQKMALQEQLKSDIIDNDIIQNQQKTIQMLKQLKLDIQNKNQQLNNINNDCIKYNNYKDKLNSIDKQILNFDEEKASFLLNQIIELKNKIIDVDCQISKFNNCKKQIHEVNSIIEKYKDLNPQDLQDIQSICNALYLMNKLNQKYMSLKNKLSFENNIIDKYKNLDDGNVLLSNIKELCNKIYLINKLENKFAEKEQKISIENDKIKYLQNFLKQKQTLLENIKKQNQVCPLCGRPYQNHVH